MNSVQLIGNLTRDIELRYTGNGKAVCDLNVAVNGIKKDDVYFAECIVWDKVAENCAQYLSKGSKVAIAGRLTRDEWTDKDTGKKRSKTKITAFSVEFLSIKSEPSQQIDNNFGDQDDVPF